MSVAYNAVVGNLGCLAQKDAHSVVIVNDTLYFVNLLYRCFYFYGITYFDVCMHIFSLLTKFLFMSKTKNMKIVFDTIRSYFFSKAPHPGEKIWTVSCFLQNLRFTFANNPHYTLPLQYRTMPKPTVSTNPCYFTTQTLSWKYIII